MPEMIVVAITSGNAKSAQDGMPASGPIPEACPVGAR
jgi:hypothetical protein